MITKSKKKTKRSEVLKKTEFSLLAPQAQRVSIAGDFNQWNPSSHPLQQDTKGTWEISLDLKPGKFEYRFLLDGEWQNDPNCYSFVENPFGTSNCLKIDETQRFNKDLNNRRYFCWGVVIANPYIRSRPICSPDAATVEKRDIPIIA